MWTSARLSRASLALAAIALASQLFMATAARAAATTGDITGTVTDASTGAPLADVRVAASSPSQSLATTTDSRGFYTLLNLAPDTYVVSYQRDGYAPATIPGVTVQQEQAVSLDERLNAALKTIATVRSTASSSLVKANQGSDVYSVGGAQLQAATNPADTHETLYQFLAITPGVTGTGFPAQPRIRGGQVTDLGYEFEGIPIQDRIVGFFTTNLANIGLSNIEVYTGGLSASDSMNGTGYFNSVLKTGTYPGFSDVSYQASSPEQNGYLTLEYGGATSNRKFSYYVGFDGVNSQNQYGYGEHTYPNVLFWDFNGPGPVKTRDWVSNFIYRPNQKNSLQVVLTNSLGEFNFNYLLPGVGKATATPALGFVPCPGNTANGNGWSGFGGGTAPNGQTCPIGMYWGALAPGTGNIYHHYGGLGKIQWNHEINDHSFFNLSLAENFNQYIFDQPVGEANLTSLENGPYNWASQVLGLPSSACPTYPYAAGSPVVQPTGDNGDICAFDDGINDFWGDRRSNMYFANLDYENTLSEHATIKAGIKHEYDNNIFNYYLTNNFNSDGTWPQKFEISTYPTVLNQVYGETDLVLGKFHLNPGLSWAQEHYGYPGGGATVSILNPTFNGTYQFDPRDVVRFSYGNTASFISSAYVYTQGLIKRNPNSAGTTFNPQLNHSADLMWEHQFDANTSIRVGPYYNKTTNYYESYRPIVGYLPVGCAPGTPTCLPQFAKTSILSNNNQHQTLGAEFGLNHIDPALRGTSFWISATYDNYWTTATALAGAFINGPLPQNLIAQGVRVRASANPLLSGTFLADYHSDRFHFDPLLYYQEGDFYNIGVTSTNGGTVAPYISQNELIAGGWWKAKVTAFEVLGPKRNIILGLTADNLFNQTNDVNPCKSDGSGCFPFDGPNSGVTAPAGTWIYQNYTQSPRTFYFFVNVKT